jgi:hypothetical protein
MKRFSLKEMLSFYASWKWPATKPQNSTKEKRNKRGPPLPGAGGSLIMDDLHGQKRPSPWKKTYQAVGITEIHSNWQKSHTNYKVQTHMSPPETSEVNKPGRSPDMIQAPGVLIARDTNNINANLQNRQKFISYQPQISSHLVEHLTIRRILDYKTQQHPAIFTQWEKERGRVESLAPAIPKHRPQRSWR